MFKIDTKDIKRLEDDLKTFAFRAFPFATKSTLNRSAFEAQSAARANVSKDMIERNKFTKQSILVEKAKTLNVRRQSATVGSIADYMEDQEFGGVKRSQGKQGVPIATSYSAGEGMNSGARTRVPKRANALQNIQLNKKRGRGKNKRQRNLIAVKEAAASGNKYVYLELQKKKGIFKVVDGKRRPKLRMVHDLTEQSVTIPKSQWLRPAVQRVEVLMPEFYREALIFQLKRHNLFKS